MKGDLHEGLSRQGFVLEKDFYKEAPTIDGLNKVIPILGLLWTAPEYLGPGIVNLDQIGYVKFKADVYSFGIVMVEILTRRLPYEEIKVMSKQHIIEAVAHLKEATVDLELIRPGSARAGKDVLAKNGL